MPVSILILIALLVYLNKMGMNGTTHILMKPVMRKKLQQFKIILRWVLHMWGKVNPSIYRALNMHNGITISGKLQPFQNEMTPIKQHQVLLKQVERFIWFLVKEDILIL